MDLRARLAMMPPGSLVPVSWLLEELDCNPATTAPGEEVCQNDSLDLTVKEVARRAGRSANTVRDWIRRGQLRAYRFQERELRITPAALAEFLEAQRNGDGRGGVSAAYKKADLGSWRTVRKAG